ncbi:hypothetical protein [Mycobacterium lepromatosis]|uniref:hypothetical protein n=1 Tax=Mycobacterium lepromatosis TaxID=480418 RepID=UPI0012E02BB5|nr:hypothetical protein [Mycobacterium lepromatosis]
MSADKGTLGDANPAVAAVQEQARRAKPVPTFNATVVTSLVFAGVARGAAPRISQKDPRAAHW